MVIAKKTEFRELTNEILSKGNILRFRALGGSMRPFIKNGEVIEVKPTSSSEISVGDVVFYRSSWGAMVAHRVLEKYDNRGKVVLVTKGDSVPTADERIYPEQVLGKVVAIERSGSRIDLDTTLSRLRSVLWVKISPHSWWIYPAFGRVKQGVFFFIQPLVQFFQGLQIYRSFAKKIWGKNIFLREATDSDVLALPQLYSRCRELGEMPKIARTKRESFKGSVYQFAATNGREVIGAITLKRFSEETTASGQSVLYRGWWIFGLVVRFRYRGLGIGERLMGMVLKKVAEKGGSEVKLLAFKNTEPARKLYQKLGFRQISIPNLEKQLDREAEKGLKRRIIMAKKL